MPLAYIHLVTLVQVANVPIMVWLKEQQSLVEAHELILEDYVVISICTNGNALQVEVVPIPIDSE